MSWNRVRPVPRFHEDLIEAGKKRSFSIADAGTRAKKRKQDREDADVFMEEVLKEWAEFRKEHISKEEREEKLKEIRRRVAASENEFLKGLVPVGCA